MKFWIVLYTKNRAIKNFNTKYNTLHFLNLILNLKSDFIPNE